MNDDWKYHIPPKRRGAYYFLNNPSRTWTASDYFDARSPSLLNKASLTGELAGWVSLFRSGGCQALSDMATSLERTDTRKYWEGKEKGSYEQEMASTVRKRSLAIRKENLKQHDIDSVAMTHELDLLHRSRSPYVEAKRRRYNTRAAASLAAPTPSSLLSAAAFKNVAQDVDEPLSPFVTHRSDTGRLNSTATSSTCAADADPGEVMDQNDQASITSTPSTSPSSYKPSEFSSPETQLKVKRGWQYIYPLGQGRLHYPATFHRSLLVDGYDAAAVLWALRENIAEKVSIAVDIESGKQIAELKRPHEFLALNHIYLVQRGDRSSSLYACVGSKLWRSLQAPAQSMLISDEVATGLVKLALQVSTVDYQDGRLLLRRDSTLEPSTRRRGVDRDSGGVRPDFQSYFRSGNNKFHLLTIEIKKKQQTTSPMLSDLEKVALQLKTVWTVLPKIASTVRVHGIVVIGHEIDLYTVSLEAAGMYIIRQLSKAYLPRNHCDLSMLPQMVNLFMGLQLGLLESYALCTRPRVNHTNTDVCPTLGMPIKVSIARASNH